MDPILIYGIDFMFQSAFFDGKSPNWFHQRCFFEKQRPASAELFDGFNKLRQADQDEIKEKIGTHEPATISFHPFY